MNYEEAAHRLLDWNRKHLTSSADLTKEMIAEVFASKFTVKANERIYSANYDNYLEFLNTFRSTIKTIDYDIDDCLVSDNNVVFAMCAHVLRIDGEQDNFVAMLRLQFDDDCKINLWQEVYMQI